VPDIVPFSDEKHREQVAWLFSDVPFKASIWNYQFLENPGALARGFHPVVAEDNNRVVGFNSVVPVSIIWNGAPLDAMWSCDFKVLAECRGQGVGRLIKEALAQKSPVLMAFGISPVATIVLGRMGWVPGSNVYFYRKIVRPKTARELALYLYQQSTACVNRAASPAPCKVTPHSKLPAAEELDRLWQGVQGGYNKAVVRDADYLNWRYQQHPLAGYRFLEARDASNTLLALGVVRCSERQARLVDYVGPARNASIKRAVVEAFLACEKQPLAYSAMTSDPELQKVFKSLGFYQGREQPRFYVWADKGRLSQQEYEHSHEGWFIMGGDSDGELLQAAKESWCNHSGRDVE
jgi:GNAT superfamily N-acetyltransferase